MVTLSLRLHFRNKLALLYSYLFPTLFLLAFYVLYRFDQVPLVRHMGALLTVTVLGGACFGLPTTMVSERERGVWRRYRLAPVPIGALVASTLLARYVLLILAGLLQLALALALGMPAPLHPFDLFAAFTLVAFAFMGLGLLIAMLANNVPAVQALGQCVFLPMLIIGGIAVPLASLPPWAQRVSLYFPGRYAVEAIQAAVAGPGLASARFSMLALLVIGAAACVAGGRLFRWDAQHRVAASTGYGWVAVALVAWLAVGFFADARGRLERPRTTAAQTAVSPALPEAPRLSTRELERPSTPAPERSLGASPSTPALERSTPAPELPSPRVPEPPRTAPPSPSTRAPERSLGAGPPRPEPPTPEPPRPEPPNSRTPTGTPSSWRGVTMEHIERDLRFDRLPPDGGVVTPIAAADEQPDTDLANHLDFISTTLLQWKPGHVADPVQRVRNVLFVAAVPDVFQMEPLERFLPWVVFEHLKQSIPADDLKKILYWIALHPGQGDDSAVDELRVFRLGSGPSDIDQARERAAIYAVKLLGRITGKIPE
jgi:ABC-type polysaccharide/polyol phosphate export permease